MIQEEYGLEMAKAYAEGAGKASVERLGDMVESLFPFFGVKKIAVKDYLAAIEASDLTLDEKMLAKMNTKKMYRHWKNQKKIAEIAQEQALPGTDFSKESKVQEEWLDRFMDAAKYVSEEEIQLIWGKLLAMEFQDPGTVPPSVIRILSEMTPKYARAFQQLCSRICRVSSIGEDGTVLDTTEAVVLAEEDNHQIKLVDLNELEAIGLIRCNDATGYSLTYDTPKLDHIELAYGGRSLSLSGMVSNVVPIGSVLLTNAGKKIAEFTERIPQEGHLERVEQFIRNSVTP